MCVCVCVARARMAITSNNEDLCPRRGDDVYMLSHSLCWRDVGNTVELYIFRYQRYYYIWIERVVGT